MENTIENKAKFFALYWGRGFKYSNDFGTYKGVVGDFHFNDNIKQKAVISLKPLSSITDEEIIECCNAAFSLAFAGNCPPKKWICTKSEVDGFVDVTCTKNDYHFDFDKESLPIVSLFRGDVMQSNCETEVVLDLLRSKGYALPFMGVSVEELVERGWIKLT